jgi:hypothetical protein
MCPFCRINSWPRQLCYLETCTYTAFVVFCFIIEKALKHSVKSLYQKKG